MPITIRAAGVTGLDHLWIADFTYIRLRDEFVFLAVKLDACSRRVAGWELDRTPANSLTLTALYMALTRRRGETGFSHHSDRGSQCASGDYKDLLKDKKAVSTRHREPNHVVQRMGICQVPLPPLQPIPIRAGNNNSLFLNYQPSRRCWLLCHSHSAALLVLLKRETIDEHEVAPGAVNYRKQ